MFFPTASPPDEALHVFAFFPAAGVAASRRRAGRARRHRPVCWSELANRQVHEADARSAQPAAALGTSSSGPHHEPPRAPAGHQLAAPGLVATRRSHRPAAHTRGARPHQDSPYRHGRASNPQPLHSLKTSPAAVGRSAARSRSTPSPATGSSTCWASGGEAMGHAAVLVRGPAPVPRDVRRDQPEHSFTAGNGVRRAAGRVCCHPQT